MPMGPKRSGDHLGAFWINLDVRRDLVTNLATGIYGVALHKEKLEDSRLESIQGLRRTLGNTL